MNARTAAPSTIWRRECWNCRTICGERHAIPDGAKLCAYADDEENTVTIGIAEYDHDLRDVPPYLLEMLAEARDLPWGI